MKQQPNILFMIADDHRFNAIHALGDETVKTPVLDSLIENGVAFRRTHIMGSLVGAVCVPSRSALLTGTNLFRSGMNEINRDLAVWPHVMQEAGYTTFATGKWHNDKQTFANSFSDGAKIFFGGMSDHLKVPVTDFDPTGRYPNEAKYVGEKFSTELFSDAAINFLQEYREDNPFFLYLAFTSPHDPRMAPQEYAAMYDSEKIPLPENFISEHPFDNGEMQIRDEKLAPWPRTPEIIRQHIADYYAMITHMDAHIGRVLDALKESGHAENTIIVYTADHGLAVGQHGLMGKQNLYDHSIRIPLIISGPGIPQGQTVDALTYLYDVFPTMCDLTGVEVPNTVEGESLVPLITDEKKELRQSVYSAYKDCHRMVSDGHWKLIRNYHSEEMNTGLECIQLFHLESDPWETQDLSEALEHAERIRELAGELKAWQKRVNDPLVNRPVLPSSNVTKS